MNVQLEDRPAAVPFYTGYTRAVETGKRLQKCVPGHELLRFVAKDVCDELQRLIRPLMTAEDADRLDMERWERFGDHERHEKLRIANKPRPSQSVLDHETFEAIAAAMERAILLHEGVTITFEQVPAKSEGELDAFKVGLAGLNDTRELPEVFDNRPKAELYLMGVQHALHAAGVSSAIIQKTA